MSKKGHTDCALRGIFFLLLSPTFLEANSNTDHHASMINPHLF